MNFKISLTVMAAVLGVQPAFAQGQPTPPEGQADGVDGAKPPGEVPPASADAPSPGTPTREAEPTPPPPAEPEPPAPASVVLSTVLVQGVVTAPGSSDPAVGAEVELRRGDAVVASAKTGADGRFAFADVAPGAYSLTATQPELASATRKVVVAAGHADARLDVALALEWDETGEVVVIEGESAQDIVESSGFAVESLETSQIRQQTRALNDVIDTLPGVRVRRSGGTGSDVSYTLQGLSGRSVRFFLDGIPLEFFGSSYGINTIPISLVERVDVYKGVVPVDIGTDALGGAVNLVTRQGADRFLEASTSYGSFNTAEWAVHGAHQAEESGLTFRASALGTSSDNDYEVWGENVVVADENARPVEIRADRFNDQFRSITFKADAGFADVSWADAATVGVIYSTLDRGIQTGQTMTQVYGDATYSEDLIVPSASYSKKDLGVDGLSFKAFAAVAIRDGVTDDTSENRYDWTGDVIAMTPSGGEINAGRGKSRYELSETAVVGRTNLSYQLSENHAVSANVIATQVRRQGDDEFAAWYTIPLLEPQDLTKVVSGASYQYTSSDERAFGNVFAKGFVYQATVNDSALTTTEDGTQVTVSRPIETSLFEPGAGYAFRYQLTPYIRLKTAAEQTYRLPDAEEALGNGFVIVNSPGLEPERSRNVNAGVRFGQFSFGDVTLSSSVNGFYRWTDNVILLTVIDGNGTGQFQNVAKTRGAGVEGEVQVGYADLVSLSVNGTYLDIRNNQEFSAENVMNVVFNDRLRNTPYAMANAGLQIKRADLFQRGSFAFAYWNTQYVHEFFLNWPSLGDARTKDVVPAQFLSDFGVSYRFPQQRSGTFSVAFDVNNAFNTQAFDNFALQRPGRAFFGKLTWQLAAD